MENQDSYGASKVMDNQNAYTASKLDKCYQDADTQDKVLFAEQRSNILLVAGDHYTNLRSPFYKRLRDSRALTQEQKIRLTMNHIPKITETYTNQIVATAPGVGLEPANENELKDLKAAELNHAVWEHGREIFGGDECVQTWAEDFVEIGEVGTKIFYDANEDEILAEDFYGFNCLIDPAAVSFSKARYVIIRKMVDIDTLKKMYPDESNLAAFKDSSEETFTIFNRGKGSYEKTKNQCLVREHYYRKSAEFPNGQYFVCIKDKILEQGDLPGGIWPIMFKPFRRKTTSARGFSVIKMLRPFQVEINRASSKIAEHQVSLGDDKVLLQKGTQLSEGEVVPGVRGLHYTGMTPVVMAGRDGSQYAAYATAKISEMYNAANVPEKVEDLNIQLDPYTLLFRSASQKKKFQLYIKRFESFLIDVCETYLELARLHFSDEKLAAILGGPEIGNIPEFRSPQKLCYKIKITAQAEDIETKLGKQLTITQALQYVGSKMEREDIGKLMRAMPYTDKEEAFSDLAIDYDSATNDILALDRGEQPPINPFDKHPYFIKRLTGRMRQADFKYLDPAIQQNYAMRLQAHEQAEAAQLQAIQQAQSGFCPTGGYLVACDFYVQSDPNDPSKTKRVRLPSESLQWLIDKMETQGASLEQLETVNQENLSQISQMISGASPQGGAITQTKGVMPGGVPSGRSIPASGTSSGPGPSSAGASLQPGGNATKWFT